MDKSTDDDVALLEVFVRIVFSNFEIKELLKIIQLKGPTTGAIQGLYCHLKVKGLTTGQDLYFHLKKLIEKWKD